MVPMSNLVFKDALLQRWKQRVEKNGNTFINTPLSCKHFKILFLTPKSKTETLYLDV